MLISVCYEQGAIVIIPNSFFAVSARYQTDSQNPADSFLKKYTINAGETTMNDLPPLVLPDFNRRIEAMDLLPLSTFVVFGGKLGIVDYVSMTLTTPTLPANSPNFKYVICIDASTCIAADDSGNGISYFDLTTVIDGSPLSPRIMVNDDDNHRVRGLSSSKLFDIVVLASDHVVYIRSIVDTWFKFQYFTEEIKSVTTAFGATLGNSYALVNTGRGTWGLKLDDWASNPYTIFFAYHLDHYINTYDIDLISASKDGKYLAMMFRKEITLYEKKPCHTSCATCSDTTATSCTNCPAPNWLYYYVNRTCGACDTANGFYTTVFLGGRYCLSCDSPCANCAGSSTNCISCIPGKCLSGNTCSNPADYFFRDPTTTNCTACDTGCKTCTSLSSCTSCDPGYYLSGGYCVSCNSTCKTCTSSAVCTTCNPNYYLGTNSSCTSCVGPWFISGNDCQACGLTCLTCSSATNCTTCDAGLSVSDTNGTCAVCGPGYLVPNTSTKCMPCDPNCVTCSGQPAHCDTCMVPLYKSVNHTCVACSTPGLYLDASSICQDCNPNCLTCGVNSTNCLTCSSGKFVSFDNGTCTPCGGNHFIQGANCKTCSSNCGTCTVTAANCTNCTSSSEVVSAINRTCGPCNPGYFVSAGLCYHCDLNCLTCETDTTNCLSCNAPLLLSSANHSCSDCGDGFFVGGDNVCYPCDPGCKTCALNNSACLSCNIGSYLQETQQKCVPCTAAGQRVRGVYCQDCTAGWNCYRCDSDPSVCDKCSGNDTIMTADNNKCGNNCNATGGSYIETVSGVSYCKQCDSSCAECGGGGTLNCTVCAGNRQMSGGECKLCPPHCSECSSPLVCETCENSYLKTASSSCIDAPTCRQGWSYVSGKDCLNCSANCKSCFGSAASCTSCIAGQYLSATNTCVPCTENGYYHNSTNCLQCDSSCLTCNGSTSTDCLSCSGLFVLADDSSCQPAPPFRLLVAAFKSDMDLATFTFEAPIRQMSSPPAVGLYTCSAPKLKALLASSSGLPAADSGCTQVERWRVKEMTVEGAHVKVKLSIDQSLDNGVLALRAPEKAYWQSDSNHLVRYPEDYLIVENVTVIKSALDGMMDSAAAPATAAMTTVQVIVMTVSLPQAFILMKVLQTLDYYIYIDCKYPSNFAKFLDMITNSAFDYLPNFFEMLVDNDGLPLYERFAEYGMKVHIFANLGQIYSVALIIGALKLVLLMLRKLWSKVDKVYNMVSPDLFFGIFESYHLDSVLSVTIFIANRDRIDNHEDAVKYLVIVFVSLFSLFMISMYLFMGYTVSRLTDSYFKHAVVEVKHMKAESWRFLLEDKNMHGNIFQRHFNLIQLFKDIVFAALLYALYYKPLVLIILLTLIQAVFTTLCLVFAPYSIEWMNISLKATQCLYLVLDVFFFLLIGWGDQLSEHTRYYVVGFTMIVLVLLILGCNIGFSLYSTFKELRDKWRRYKAKKTRELGHKQSASNNKAEPNGNVSINAVCPIADETGIDLNSSKDNVNRSLSRASKLAKKTGKISSSLATETKNNETVPTKILNATSNRSKKGRNVLSQLLTASNKKQVAGKVSKASKQSINNSQATSLDDSNSFSQRDLSLATSSNKSPSREKALRFEYFNKKQGQPTRLRDGKNIQN